MSLKCLYQTRRVSGNVDVTEVFVPSQESEWQCRWLLGGSVLFSFYYNPQAKQGKIPDANYITTVLFCTYYIITISNKIKK